MSATEILRRRNWDEIDPPLQHPAIDPVMMIASLLGPGMMRGLMGGVSRGAANAAPEIAPQFSQGDSMLARLRANQPQVRGRMVAEQLPSYFKKAFSNMQIPKNTYVMDRPTPPPYAQMPQLSDPLSWLEHPNFWGGPNRGGGAQGFPDWVMGMQKLLGKRSAN